MKYSTLELLSMVTILVMAVALSSCGHETASYTFQHSINNDVLKRGAK
jgi:uncharacterized lipoprotein YehR (DUF1307 family)